MHLIDNLLQCIRFELGALDYQPNNIAIDTVVQNVLILLKGNARQKNVEHVYESHPEAEVVADSTMFRFILQNLIGNAKKFTPSNGRVTVQEAEQGDRELISVVDNGIGISPEKLSHLLDSLVVQSTDGAAGGKGGGLGLALCKDLVEKHGGRLWVDSLVGQGTSFHFALPNAHSAVSV